VTAIVPFAGPDNSYDGTVEVSIIQPPNHRPVEHYRILSFNVAAGGYEVVGLDSSFQVAGDLLPLDVDYFDDSPGERSPATALFPPGDRFVFDSVRFEFSSPVTPSETSRTMFVVPNADIIIYELQGYGAGVLVRDALGVVSKAPFPTFPVIVPEPTTKALLGTSLLGAIWACRRRHRSAAAFLPAVAGYVVSALHWAAS